MGLMDKICRWRAPRQVGIVAEDAAHTRKVDEGKPTTDGYN